MPAPSSLLAAAVASLLAGNARALTVVDWRIPSDGIGPLAPLTVSVGDVVRFDYDPGHNVVLHPTGTCDDEGGTYLGGTSPTEYTFAEAGTHTFACDVADGVHCSLGQIITITVTDDAANSGKDAEGAGEEAVISDAGAGEDPGASIPAPPDEDPVDVLERFDDAFNDGEERGLLEFRMKPYTIPSKVTTYIDFLFNIPEDLPEVVHIVAGDVINSQPKHLHHFVLTGCFETVDPAKEGLPQFEVPESCNIPLGGGWAAGGDFFGGIPLDSGEVFGAALGIKSISLNVHYTDGQAVDLRYPNDGTNAIATDGFRMMYTTDLRPKTIVYRPLIDIGSGPGKMRVPPNDPRHFLTKTCTVETGCRDLDDDFLRDAAQITCGEIKAFCSPGNDALPASERMYLQSLCPVSCGLCDGGDGGDVTAVERSGGGGPDSDGWRIDAVKYHAHLIGREMYTTLLPNERSDVPIDLESQALWLYDNQVTYAFPESLTDESHFRVFPRDKIQASCVYDSTSREGPTSFGVSTYDEMCITQVSVVIDTPDVSADSGASLIALINAKTFNCALDDESAIWNGSLDAEEDAQYIWKDHPISEADCTFPVGSAFGGSLSLKFDAFPTFEARCEGDSSDGGVSGICNENQILDPSAVVGETCSGGSMDGADSNDPSAYDVEGDATFGEQCSAKGGSSAVYTCQEVEDVIGYLPFDDQTLEYYRTSLWQPKCCTKGEPISICDENQILDPSAVAGNTCTGGSMNQADSNDPSAYDAEGDATFGEKCSAKGGSSEAYACQDAEEFLNFSPLDDQSLEYLRTSWWQPKCCSNGEPISICDDGIILKGDAIAGFTCNGGSMDGVDSNDPSGFDTTSDVTFKEQCVAKGGVAGGEYTCKQLEDFFFNGPMSAGIKPEELESMRVSQFQPKCCTGQEKDIPSAGDVTVDSSGDVAVDSSGESPGDSAVEEATSGDDPDEDPSQGENGDAPGADVQTDGTDEAESGTFAKSPSLLFLSSVVACFLGII